MRRFLPVLLLLTACGAPAPSSPSGGQSRAVDTCAGDPWLAQLLGERPASSSAMRLEGMRRTRLFGQAFAQLQTVQMDYLYELQDVRSSAAETYEWRAERAEKALVTVLRGAFGDPRALKEGSVFLYGPPTHLANGALEYPPTNEATDLPFRPRGGRTLYTFPDGTWVRVDSWMAPRVRGAFASASPPLPPSGPDVAWEVCAGSAGVDRSNAWGVRPERSVLRMLAGREVDAEMVFRFPSEGLAVRAEGEQRLRCSQSPGPAARPGDKGIFSLIPPCTGVVATSVEGPLLRYTLRLGP